VGNPIQYFPRYGPMNNRTTTAGRLPGHYMVTARRSTPRRRRSTINAIASGLGSIAVGSRWSMIQLFCSGCLVMTTPTPTPISMALKVFTTAAATFSAQPVPTRFGANLGTHNERGLHSRRPSLSVFQTATTFITSIGKCVCVLGCGRPTVLTLQY